MRTKECLFHGNKTTAVTKTADPLSFFPLDPVPRRLLRIGRAGRLLRKDVAERRRLPAAADAERARQRDDGRGAPSGLFRPAEPRHLPAARCREPRQCARPALRQVAGHARLPAAGHRRRRGPALLQPSRLRLRGHRARNARQPAVRRDRGGREHHHAAARQESFPLARAVLRPQGRGVRAGARHGVELLEGRDPRDVPQHHLLRLELLRHRRRLRGLLRQAAARSCPARIGHARRPAERPPRSTPPTSTS